MFSSAKPSHLEYPHRPKVAMRAPILLSVTLFLMGSAAHADGLKGSSVTYEVKQLKEDKAAYAEGQASSTLSASCKERSFGEILLLAIERKNAATKKITEKSERIEEKVSAQEALDG